VVGISLLLIVLQQAAASPQADTATAARHAFEEATGLFEKNDNEKALAAYERAIALDAGQAEFHLGRCRTLARLQRHDEAIASCGDAISRNPDLAAAWLDRGHFYINTRKVDRALTDLMRARQLNADPYGVVYHLALGYYMAGDFAKAAAEYEACVPNAKTDDNRIACSAWQYVALLRAGRKDDAAKVLDRTTPGVKVQSSAAYLDRLLLFKGAKTEEDVAKAMEKDNLQLPTIAYGVGVWHLLNGRGKSPRVLPESHDAARAAERIRFGGGVL